MRLSAGCDRGRFETFWSLLSLKHCECSKDHDRAGIANSQPLMVALHRLMDKCGEAAIVLGADGSAHLIRYHKDASM